MDVPETELDVRLNDYVDLDAIDSVFAACYDGTPREGGRIEFSIASYRVVVVGSTRVVVTPE
jgi:hypothetical protein